MASDTGNKTCIFSAQLLHFQYFLWHLWKSVTDCTIETVVQQKEEGIPPVKQVRHCLQIKTVSLCSNCLVTRMFRPLQLLEEVDSRLMTLSEKITMCDRVLEDLKDLGDLVVSCCSPHQTCALLQILKIHLGCFCPTEETFPRCVFTTAEVTRSGTVLSF